MVRNRGRSTVQKMAFAAICTLLCIEGMLQRGLYVPVHAEDSSPSDAIQMAGNLFWSNPLVSNAKNAILTEYTSLDPTEIAVLEWELGAGYQMVDYAIKNANCVENGVEFSGSLGGSRSVTGICVYVDSNNITIEGLGSILQSDNSLSFVSDGGNISVQFIASSQYVTASYSAGGSSWDAYTQFLFVRKSGTVGDIQSLISSDGVFDVPSGLYVNTSGDIFVCQYAGYVNNLSSLPTLNSYSRMFYGNTGSAFTQGSRPSYLLKMCKNGVSEYDIDNNPVDFLAKAKSKAVTLFGQQAVDDYWIDVDLDDSGLPDTGSLNSLNFPPGLPSVEFNDVELPSEPLPAKALQGAGFWFSSFSNMLDALGVKYIVITFLIIALIMAILKI